MSLLLGGFGGLVRLACRVIPVHAPHLTFFRTVNIVNG